MICEVLQTIAPSCQWPGNSLLFAFPPIGVSRNSLLHLSTIVDAKRKSPPLPEYLLHRASWKPWAAAIQRQSSEAEQCSIKVVVHYKALSGMEHEFLVVYASHPSGSTIVLGVDRNAPVLATAASRRRSGSASQDTSQPSTVESLSARYLNTILCAKSLSPSSKSSHLAYDGVQVSTGDGTPYAHPHPARALCPALCDHLFIYLPSFHRVHLHLHLHLQLGCKESSIPTTSLCPLTHDPHALPIVRSLPIPMLFLRARDMSRSHRPFWWCRDGARGRQASDNMAWCARVAVFSAAFSGKEDAGFSGDVRAEFSGTDNAAEYAPVSTGQFSGPCRARCAWSRGGAV